MTREEAKALLGSTALLMFEHNGSSTLDGDKTLHIIDKIFDEHGEQLREAMKPKTCKLCVYCEPFNSVCFNDKSPLCADFVNSEYGCIYWERKATT